MQLTFKAYGATELEDGSLELCCVYHDYPHEITDEDLITDIMRNLYFRAGDLCYEYGIEHGYITVVAYHGDRAYCSTDFNRRYPGSVDRWYGDDVALELQKL